LYYSEDRIGNPVYPSDAAVGKPDGSIARGIKADNYAPWCVRQGNEEVVKWLKQTKGLHDDQIPYCPPQLFAKAFGSQDIYLAGPVGPSAIEDKEQRARWLRHGGLNAGIAVYYYLDRLSKGDISSVPNFDSQECAQ
jgi:hypothetical protein